MTAYTPPVFRGIPRPVSRPPRPPAACACC